MKEHWRPIPGIPFYEASSLGRIRSLDRVRLFVGRWGPTKRFHKGRILRLKRKPNGWGAFYLFFYADGGHYHQVNRIVCEAFNGAPPTDKHEAAHLDGDSENNKPGNLTWATATENAAHKKLHGTAPIGSRNGTSILAESDVIEILRRFVRGENKTDLAAAFRCSTGSIAGIVSGRTWRHVGCDDLLDRAAKILRNNLLDGWRKAARRRAERGPSLKRVAA